MSSTTTTGEALPSTRDYVESVRRIAQSERSHHERDTLERAYWAGRFDAAECIVLLDDMKVTTRHLADLEGRSIPNPLTVGLDGIAESRVMDTCKELRPFVADYLRENAAFDALFESLVMDLRHDHYLQGLALQARVAER
jgi:hypothetical protein